MCRSVPIMVRVARGRIALCRHRGAAYRETVKHAALVSFFAWTISGCLLGPSDDFDDGGDGGVTPEGEDVPASAYCDPVSDFDADAAAAELRVLELVNEVRATGGSCGGQAFGATGPLQMNGALRCAARVHSLDMASRGFFDHVNPDGEDPGIRIERAGYGYFTAGENIAAGQATPEEVMAGWLDSPGHCMNILSPDFAEIGVGYVSAPGSAYPHYWTQTFGAR